jgi:4-diphosphocytidyl-2-C-methyl-D-erythritol kinase
MFFVYNILNSEEEFSGVQKSLMSRNYFGGHMNILEVNAPAKINLSLDVIRKREDGYHDLKMIMQTVSLYDTVLMEESGEGFTIECDGRFDPFGTENTVYKAAELLFSQFGIKRGLKIRLIKRIPVAAGLAGGSTDAAAVIRGINSMFTLGMTTAEMEKAGKSVGADVPYCIEGGTALAEGIGEILTRLPLFNEVDIVILRPKIGVSTPWVFKNLKLDRISERPNTDLLISSIRDRNITRMAENMVNVLETVTIPEYPVVDAAKKRLLELGAAGSIMSGSGPSVFGIFSDRDKAAYAAERLLSDPEWDSFLVQTI